MKRLAITLCVATMLATTAFATNALYPTSVEEFTVGEEYRIHKTYQLSRTDDPALIPTDDFERNGLTYTLLDVTRTDTVGVDVIQHTESVTQASSTNNTDTVLTQLSPTLDVTTQDGYVGTLALDVDSVEIVTDGYATGTRDHSATRTYPNLSDSDLSLIPKSVEEDGRTLDLADIQWEESLQSDGIGGTVTRYTATATYTGTSTYQYATGYTVTANYTGEVAKTDVDIVEYTAMFGGTVTAEEVVELPEIAASEDDSSNTIFYIVGGGATVLILGYGVYLLIKRKRGTT
ncbi:hypothetical protein RFF05_07290 [Bengtsoniella intestinalis]|uniref:hypothetical protein n=1 Tax=Bengtsoniella intestinalis TaxID=3073143 RepID=UPI00391F56CE